MLDGVNIMSSVAVYQQIENHVQAAIASGALKGGDQLPSVRELSERLQLNPNTVAKAYRDLEVMGYLYTRRGMGVFIQRGIEDKCRKEFSEKLITRLHEVLAEAKSAGISNADINAITKKCLEAKTGPYEEVPKTLLSMARKV